MGLMYLWGFGLCSSRGGYAAVLRFFFLFKKNAPKGGIETIIMA